MAKTKIISLNNEGMGVGRINNKVVFIPYTLTGEEVDVDIVDDRKKYSIGKSISINNESFERREPLCPHYYNCGGCNLMHQKYEYQLEYKKNKVINNLKHISNIDIDSIDIDYDNEYYYRNHIILHVNGSNLGFYKYHSKEIINIDNCLISSKKINSIIIELKEFLNTYKENNIKIISIKAYDKTLINITSDSFSLIDEFVKYVNIDSLYINDKLVYGDDNIEVTLDKYRFKVSSNSFFQKNTSMTLKLYEYVKNNVDYDSNILDLYCGVGSIGIYVSDKVKFVVGIEQINNAVKNAKENAKLNNIHNIKFICGKVENNLENITNVDTIIVDPPRVGLDRKVINNILNLNPKKIIYVSCNSTTLARDINYLNNYGITSIKLFDLFPNTYHCESVTVLERKESRV